MDSEADPISEYKASLNDLSFNSKPLINMLTMLSEDYKDSKAPQIVAAIEQRLHTVAADKKLPIIYLLDSICKNVGNVYVRLFTQNIVSTFCEVFEKVDEKTRLSLYKLRQTWATIFPTKKLYAIDSRIKSSLDPAWPITAPKPHADPRPTTNSRPTLQSVVRPANTPNTTAATTATAAAAHPAPQGVHINPKFFNDPNLHPPIPTGPEAELAKQLIQKQNELLQLQKQKLELEMLNEKRKLAEQARALQEKEQKLKQKEQMLRPNSPNGKKIKKRKRSRSHRSPSPISQKSRSSPHRWTQSPNERLRDSPQPLNRQQSPSYGLRPNNAHRPRSRSPNAVKPYIPQQSVVALPPIQSSVNSLSSNLVSGHSSQPPVPTTIPAPTILAQPEMLSISNSIDSSVVTTMSSSTMRPPITSHISQISGPQHLSNPIEPSFPSWGQDRDYRKELDLMMSDAKEKLRSGVISSADHDVLVREVQRQIREAQNNSVVMNSSIPEPMTIPVDGKLRKLFYLDDTTAVVLLNAPQNATFTQLINVDPKALDPRQISFEGKPTKVFIDQDRGCLDFVTLEFNGQERLFQPNNNPIPQRIKFGGPAKEIILNGQSYPAKFGGPAITVWFDGDPTGPHSLTLDAPTPRVKLSDNRRFDLWTNIINKATNNMMPNVVNSSAPVRQTGDVNDLLSKLLAAGMINNNTNSNTNSINNNNINNSKPEATKPIPKDVKKDTKERRRENIVSKESPIELKSDSLKMSRPSVVAALYNGIQCTNCSLRFDGDSDQTASGDKTRYSKHLDWHFRQNRRDKAKPNSSATSLRRNWFYPLNLWIQYNEVTEEEDTTGLFPTEEQVSDEEEEPSVLTVIAEKDESLNYCAVCHEKFDQHWNEEEEEWRLENAVKHNNKIYHPLCLNDVLAQTERIEQQLSESVVETKEETNVEESFQTENSEDIDKSDTNCDVSPQELSEPVVSESVVECEPKVEAMETNESEVSDKEVMEAAKEVISEPPMEDIKVIEFEIPLNNDREVTHELTDSLETKEGDEEVKADNENIDDENSNDAKVVLQQGGIVIKMKASNLQTQATVQSSEPIETNETKESEVIVRGQELSSLCNIL